MSYNMQVGNMMNVRPADVGVPGQVAGPQVAAFGPYKAGETVQGEVVSVTDNTANIQLPSGKEVQMQFPQGVPANPGDTVDMLLVSKSQNSVELKLDAINGQSVRLEATDAEAYLMDRGIPPTKLNEAAAQVFIRNQIIPTPRNVANLIDIAASLPDVPTSVALAMAQNNVPPTQENADILAKWSSGPATLGNDVAALESMVAKDGGVQQFTSALESNVQQQNVSPQLQQTITQAPGFAELANHLAGMTGQDAAPAQQAIADFVATLDLPPQEQQAAQTALTDAFAATAEQAGDPVQFTQTAQPEQPSTGAQQAGVQQQGAPAEQAPASAQGTETAPASQETVQNSAAQSAPAQAQAAAAQNEPSAPQNTGRADFSQLQAAIEKAGGQQTQKADSQQTAQALQAREQEPAQQAAKTQDTWNGPRRITVQAEPQQTEQASSRPGMPQNSDAAIRNEASQILSNLQKFVVHTKGDRGAVQEDGAALQQGVRHQRELANMTKDAVSRLFGQEAPAAQKANELSSQVRLGSQMDQFFYAQVPYQTAEQKGTADLYVFQRRPQKAESEKSHITVLIGLDTQHMGRVESVLRSAEGRLSVEFRVSSARVQRFMEDSMKTFSEEMKENGFPLDNVSVTQIKEKVTPLNAMKVMEPKKEVRLQGLDIEA